MISTFSFPVIMIEKIENEINDEIEPPLETLVKSILNNDKIKF